MEKGLYEFIKSIADITELNSDNLQEILEKERIDFQMKKRLEEWLEELKFWEEYSNIYKNLEKARPYKSLSKTFRKLAKPVSGNTWLDVGCGPAKMSQLIWQKSNKTLNEITAMDIVLEPARETLNQPGEDAPVKLVYANIGERLPFKDRSFDGIIANLILPYVTDFEGKAGAPALKKALKEMFRVLKPGGQMLWSTPKPNVRFQIVFLASLPDMLNIYHYIRHKDFTRVSQGARILKHALAIQEKGRRGKYTFLSAQELNRILREIGFDNPTWKKTFAQQVLVNRVYKPS